MALRGCGAERSPPCRPGRVNLLKYDAATGVDLMDWLKLLNGGHSLALGRSNTNRSHMYHLCGVAWFQKGGNAVDVWSIFFKEIPARCSQKM